MLEFGRRPPEGTAVLAAWGARAIYKNTHPPLIDTLPDRQQMVGDDEGARRRLGEWLNGKALKRLMRDIEALRSGLPGDSPDVVTFEDGPFHLEASPQCSHGYLYIGAWILDEQPVSEAVHGAS